MAILNCTVNGEPTSVEVNENEYLAEVLRYRLGLTGTKIGCNEAECGICTVLVNGTPVDSCIYPLFKAQGANVQTIEGLAEGAFVDVGAGDQRIASVARRARAGERCAAHGVDPEFIAQATH